MTLKPPTSQPPWRCPDCGGALFGEKDRCECLEVSEFNKMLEAQGLSRIILPFPSSEEPLSPADIKRAPAALDERPAESAPDPAPARRAWNALGALDSGIAAPPASLAERKAQLRLRADVADAFLIGRAQTDAELDAIEATLPPPASPSPGPPEPVLGPSTPPVFTSPPARAQSSVTGRRRIESPLAAADRVPPNDQIGGQEPTLPAAWVPCPITVKLGSQPVEVWSRQSSVGVEVWSSDLEIITTGVTVESAARTLVERRWRRGERAAWMCWADPFYDQPWNGLGWRILWRFSRLPSDFEIVSIRFLYKEVLASVKDFLVAEPIDSPSDIESALASLAQQALRRFRVEGGWRTAPEWRVLYPGETPTVLCNADELALVPPTARPDQLRAIRLRIAQSAWETMRPIGTDVPALQRVSDWSRETFGFSLNLAAILEATPRPDD